MSHLSSILMIIFLFISLGLLTLIRIKAPNVLPVRKYRIVLVAIVLVSIIGVFLNEKQNIFYQTDWSASRNIVSKNYSHFQTGVVLQDVERIDRNGHVFQHEDFYLDKAIYSLHIIKQDDNKVNVKVSYMIRHFQQIINGEQNLVMTVTQYKDLKKALSHLVNELPK